MQGLVQALAPYPQMLVQFICWLFRERLMEQYNGVNLLRSCFTTMSYEDSKVLTNNGYLLLIKICYISTGFLLLFSYLISARL